MSKRVIRVIRAIITMSAPTHWKQLHRRVIKVIRAIMAIRVVRVSGAVKSMGVRVREMRAFRVLRDLIHVYVAVIRAYSIHTHIHTCTRAHVYTHHAHTCMRLISGLDILSLSLYPHHLVTIRQRDRETE